jgi:hypothetical protein
MKREIVHMSPPASSSLTHDVMDRIAALERNQRVILSSLTEIAAVLSRLEASLGAADHAGSEVTQATSGDDLPDDGTPLIDVVWDTFEFNADAYAFWHTPHDALGGKSPKSAAGDPGAEAIIRRLIAKIRSEN